MEYRNDFLVSYRAEACTVIGTGFTTLWKEDVEDLDTEWLEGRKVRTETGGVMRQVGSYL